MFGDGVQLWSKLSHHMGKPTITAAALRPLRL